MKDQERYHSRKGHVMATLSFDIKFQFISCGFEGPANDAKVL